MTSNETALSFMKRAITAHTVTKARKDMTGTVTGGKSDSTGHKLQPPLKSFIESPSDTTSKIEHTLASPGVMKIRLEGDCRQLTNQMDQDLTLTDR